MSLSDETANQGPAGDAPMRSDGGPAYHQLAARLRDDIIAGRLSPGDQLPKEPDLSDAYKVSRGTAREAIRALEGHGLVTVKRGVTGGTFVSVPSADRIRESLQTGLALLSRHSEITAAELVEIREILEVPAAELAALRHNDQDLKAIRESLFDTRSMAPSQVYACSQRFHTCIQRAAHNPLLDIVAEPIAYVIENRIGQRRDPEFWRAVDIEHQEILGYLEARDQKGTREAMRAHLRAVRPAYESISRERAKGVDI